MRRLFITILSVLSLLLCIAVATMWVRSYYRCDMLDLHTKGGDRYGCLSVCGSIVLEQQLNEVFEGTASPPGWVLMSRSYWLESFRTAKWGAPAYEWRLFGYGVVVNRGVITPGVQGVTSARPGAWRNLVVILPHWVLLVPLALPPLLSLCRWKRVRSRRKLGLCPVCGYDLRASKDRCPECGTPILPHPVAGSGRS